MGVKKKTLKFALEKEQIMGKDDFFMLLSEEVKTYKDYLETGSHDWIVKGFIDIDKNVYTIIGRTTLIRLTPRRQELVNPIIMTFPLIRNILRDSRISCTS